MKTPASSVSLVIKISSTLLMINMMMSIQMIKSITTLVKSIIKVKTVIHTTIRGIKASTIQVILVIVLITAKDTIKVKSLIIKITVKSIKLIILVKAKTFKVNHPIIAEVGTFRIKALTHHPAQVFTKEINMVKIVMTIGGIHSTVVCNIPGIDICGGLLWVIKVI